MVDALSSAGLTPDRKGLGVLKRPPGASLWIFTGRWQTRRSSRKPRPRGLPIGIGPSEEEAFRFGRPRESPDANPVDDRRWYGCRVQSDIHQPAAPGFGKNQAFIRPGIPVPQNRESVDKRFTSLPEAKSSGDITPRQPLPGNDADAGRAAPRCRRRAISNLTT